ncbi:MAG: hypothetical protein WA771_05745 [Chthoniobacterales bacterium]
MNKAELIAAIQAALQEEFERRLSASRETRAGGNDEESRAEDKYDTLSTEQNYLADGLAKQAQSAREALDAYEKLVHRSFALSDPIDLGAAVELSLPRERAWFFLGPAGGGQELQFDGKLITIITPESPLGTQLRGRKVGDATTRPPARIEKVL